jgi:hypothetical protein
MNTDTISTGIIAVDYSKSLQNMMADGSYDWVNAAITPKGFPITAVGIVQFETKVFHFNRYVSSEDAVEAITADDRRNFWDPAKIEGLLAYGVKNPNEQRQYPIVGWPNAGLSLAHPRRNSVSARAALEASRATSSF